MNRTRLNAALLGNGTPNNRIPLALGTIVSVVTSVVIAAQKLLSAASSAVMSSVMLLTKEGAVSGSTSAYATTAITLGKFVPKPFSPLQTSGQASTTMVLRRCAYIAAAAPCVASTTITLATRMWLGGSFSAQASTAVTLSTWAANAPFDRTTRIPYEYRETAVQ